jgi:hypothetical protein
LIGEDEWLIRIVMRNRRDAAEQILDTAPDQPDLFRKQEMFLSRRLIGAMNVGGPILGIRVRPTAESGKKVELEMIVGVD